MYFTPSLEAIQVVPQKKLTQQSANNCTQSTTDIFYAPSAQTVAQNKIQNAQNEDCFPLFAFWPSGFFEKKIRKI